MQIEIDEREQAAIVAGLKCWQVALRTGSWPGWTVRSIKRADAEGTVGPIEPDEIDSLCAKLAIERQDVTRITRDNAPPLKIARWFRVGEFVVGPLGTIQDVLAQAGTVLDRYSTGDMLGDVLFQTEDGRYWTVNVEVELVETDLENACYDTDDERAGEEP